jgi:hypothetical protein
VETPESVSSEDEKRSEWSFASMRKGAMWTRQTMFDGGRGEIGLAGSIFRLLGTPSDEDWPVSGCRSREIRSAGLFDCAIEPCGRSRTVSRHV